MSCSVILGGKCVTFFTSVFDVISDFINSMEFLGYGISSNDTHIVQGQNDTEITFNHCTHPNWAICSIVTIFLPGILSGIPALIQKYYDKNWPGMFLAAAVMLLFPFVLVVQQIRGIINTYRKQKRRFNFLDDHAYYVGAEAYFESFPQLALQLYTICNGYDMTTVQIISIIFSLFSIAKTSITTDKQHMEDSLKDTSATFYQHFIHTIRIIPCYLTTILFRVASFSLTITFLRYYAIIPCFMLLTELAIPCFLRIKHIKDKTSIIDDSLFIWLTNISVTNAYGLGTEFTEDNKTIARFIRNSSIITFFHHIAVLVIIMLIAVCNPGYFDYWTNDDFRLTPTRCHFYWAFGMTFLMGCYSLNLILYRARDMANLDVKNEKVTTPTKKITDKFNSIQIKTYLTKIEEKVEKHVSVPKLTEV